MEVLHSFGSWDQEIDSRFTNHEPLIPAYAYKKYVVCNLKIKSVNKTTSECKT